MNLALYFEGTGQGVVGNITNVTRLHDLCVEDGDQKLHIESGPGTHFGAYLTGSMLGLDWKIAFRNARRWFEGVYSRYDKVFLFGFSRGASIARLFAGWLDKMGVEVAYLGLWDTVDATPGLEIEEACPPNVRLARHAIARDERRKFFAVVPLVENEAKGMAVGGAKRVMQMVFPGFHSDVGGFYEDNHVIADVALAWIAAPAVKAGLRLKKGVRLIQKARAEAAVHPSDKLISNMFGVLGLVGRKLAGIRKHPLCKLVREKVLK